MFRLTQILATSKACQQTSVNLLVTSAMDIDQQATALCKKLEQIKFKLDNADLSANKSVRLSAINSDSVWCILGMAKMCTASGR